MPRFSRPICRRARLLGPVLFSLILSAPPLGGATEPKPLLTLAAFDSGVSAVAFSPDGKTLATTNFDSTVKLWDAATGRERAASKRHAGDVLGVAFSPDGKLLATASKDQTVRLWDATSLRERASLVGHGALVECVAFSPDGATLASGADDGTVIVWDTAANKQIAALRGHTGPVEGAAFSPDGRFLASASDDRTVKIWDLATGKERAALLTHTSQVWGVAFSPDGRTLATASRDKTIKLWEVATFKERATLEGHTALVASVTFSPDGKTLASASADKTVKLWDLGTYQERATLQGHEYGVNFVAFRPDGKALASASYDKTAIVWEAPAAAKDEPAPAPDAKTLDHLWAALADEDASKADEAVRALRAAPEAAVKLAAERLRPAAKTSPKAIATWIADLDSNDYGKREKATEELQKSAAEAETQLRAALANKPSLEVRYRVEEVLSALRQPPPDLLQALRAVELLEGIGTPDARKTLAALADGAAGARLTEEAKASLARLKKADAKP